jgi:DNA-binding NarL/FixJ family response regulator
MSGPRRSQPREERVGVLIVDDHPLVRQGLASLIGQTADLQICAQAADAASALLALDESNPDVALVDLSLRGSNGIDLIKEIRRRAPQVDVLVLTMHDEAFYAERSLRAGARGYVMKGEEPDEVLDAIRRVRRGEVYVSPRLHSELLRRAAQACSDSGTHAVGSSGSADASDPSAVESLSDRELEVFELVGRGFRTSEIAERLCVSVKTVETHRHRIKEKLGLRTGQQMVRYAIRWVEAGALTPGA